MLNIPRQIVRGDRVEWRDANLDISFALNWALRGIYAKLDIVSTVEGSEFITVIESAQSETLFAGNYLYQAFLLDGENRKTVDFGQIEVIENLSTLETVDPRNNAEKILEKVEEAILALTTGGAVQSYSIKGRSLSRYSLEELIKLRDKLRAEVSRAKNGGNRRIYTRFNLL